MKHIAHKVFEEKNKNTKGFDFRQWKINHMNNHIKDFTCQKLSTWEKIKDFPKKNYYDASQTACLYDPYILSTS